MDYKFLQGSGFYFRELRQEDLQGNWYNWFNDGEVTLYQNKKYFPNIWNNQNGDSVMNIQTVYLRVLLTH